MAGLMQYTRIIGAGKSTKIEARGVLVYVRDTITPVSVKMRQAVKGKSGQAYEVSMRRGEKWFASEEFTQVEIFSAATFDQTVTVFIGYGDYIPPPPAPATADTFLAVPDVDVNNAAPVLIRDDNPTRFRVTVKSKITNTQNFRIAGSSAELLAGGGITLEPGDSYTGQARGELWGLRAAAGVLLVEVLDEQNNV